MITLMPLITGPTDYTVKETDDPIKDKAFEFEALCVSHKVISEIYVII
jgi:hypothetical protein